MKSLTMSNHCSDKSRYEIQFICSIVSAYSQGRHLLLYWMKIKIAGKSYQLVYMRFLCTPRKSVAYTFDF